MNDATRSALARARIDQAKSELRELIRLGLSNGALATIQAATQAGNDAADIRQLDDQDLLQIAALASYAFDIGLGMILDEDEGVIE